MAGKFRFTLLFSSRIPQENDPSDFQITGSFENDLVARSTGNCIASLFGKQVRFIAARRYVPGETKERPSKLCENQLNNIERSLRILKGILTPLAPLQEMKAKPPRAKADKVTNQKQRKEPRIKNARSII